MQIILDSEKLINISYELKFRSIDYYLLFETMRKTGRTAASLINLKVKDVDRFIKDNSYFLGRKLCEDLTIHKNGRDRDSPFFSSRKLENSGEYLPIPLRTLQSRLKELGITNEQLVQTLLLVVAQRLVPKISNPVDKLTEKIALFELLHSEQLSSFILNHLYPNNFQSLNLLLKEAYTNGYITKSIMEEYQLETISEY